MPHRRGYAPIGERCFSAQDWNAKGRTNVIGALMGFCLLTVALFTDSINADVFFAWITQELLPKLPNNSVIVMDNASFHQRTDIQRDLLQAGHIFEYLPPYSPYLNPIEHYWALLKALRNRQHCSVVTLIFAAISFNHFIVR